MSSRALEITELPAGKSTNDFKSVLAGLVEADVIRRFSEHHTNDKVHFKIVTKDLSASATDSQLAKVFKLRANIATSNMHAFDALGKIQKYDSATKILEQFCDLRLDLYSARKHAMIAALEAQ